VSFEKKEGGGGEEGENKEDLSIALDRGTREPYLRDGHPEQILKSNQLLLQHRWN
jgi:hypothetical protein